MTDLPPDWLTLNRANWDERTAVHVAPGGYDLSALRAGQGRLDAITEAELGPVDGLRVAHLQCHFGKDTLTLAQRGAQVVGLDFSPAAIAAARALAAELGLQARFVEAPAADALEAIGEPGTFDRVFTTWGTITWLPELGTWASAIAGLLRPAGSLYFADAHPWAYTYDDEAALDAAGRPGLFLPYLGRAPFVYDQATDYSNEAAVIANTRQVNFLHPLGDIIGALHGAGLQLEWLHEHPGITWRMFRQLERGSDGLWTWPGKPWFPLSLSLRAVKPG